MRIVGRYAADTGIQIALSSADEGDVPIMAASVKIQIRSDAEDILLPFTQVTSFVANDTTYSFQIPQSVNQLSPGNVREGRIIVTEFTLANTLIITERSMYIIERGNVLVPYVNSWQTLAQAEVLSLSMSGVDDWKQSSDDQKLISLESAYASLCRLTYTVLDPNSSGLKTALGFDDSTASNRVLISDINSIDGLIVQTFPQPFLLALRRAQLAEANFSLSDQSITEKRAGGLMSETVGESSQMWRPGKPILLGACRAALNELIGYIHYGKHIARA